MEARDIIKSKREKLGFTQTEVAAQLGLGLRMYQKIEDGQFPKFKRENIRKLDQILGTNVYELIYESSDENHSVQEPKTPYIDERRLLKSTGNGKRIPLYDAPASAGIIETEMTAIHAPAGTIDVGDLLNDSQAAIRIYGNSMIPNYPPGCVVGLAKCSSLFIEPGEVYVIETRDRRLLKRLFYKEDDPDSEYFVCYSDNIMKFEGGAREGKPAYPPFIIPRSEIINLFSVTGVIKRNTNSIIINRMP